MTPDETRAAAQLMLDWADQQFDVQSQPKHWAHGPTLQTVWADTKDPQWNWHEFCYRCKPTANLRPYTAEECVGLVGREVVDGDACKWVVELVMAGVSCTVVLLAIEAGSYPSRKHLNPSGLQGHYTFLDGSPCGVEVE